MDRAIGQLSRGVTLALAAALVATAMAGTASAQEAGESPRAFEVSVIAEVLEADAPVEVEATEVTEAGEAGDGRLMHGVAVTWTGAADAVLGDERFTHHATSADGDGDLVLAGQGCGAEWADGSQEVIHPCTLDLRTIPVSTGDTHEYPVWIHPSVGPLALEEGTYQVDQVVAWWSPDDEEAQEQFTIRLTYEVTERDVTLATSVHASVVDSSAPVSVQATPVEESDGELAHGVRVTWNGDAEVRLDDARFTHHVSAASGGGDLVTAGRGCGANWSEATGQVEHFCTDDLQFIDLAPGETHEYPVTIVPDLEGLSLEPGTYTVEETIGWMPLDGGTGEEFTVRLTYIVSAAGTATLTPEPADSGITIASWSGGALQQLPPADSYWVSVEGEWAVYVPDAPEFANARFFSLFPGDLPAGTLLVVVR